jgi:nucleoside-diphosphate-sugar epimerase
MRDLIGGSVEPTFAEARAGDVRDSQADISKARRLLGYEPTVEFEEGLRRTVEWYRSETAPATTA